MELKGQYLMAVRCMYCDTLIRHVTAEIDPSGLVSHGICPECFDRIEKELQAMIKERDNRSLV